jgi:ATP-dependent Zn protease
VNDALNTAKKILLENKDKLDILVDKLLEKTTLYNEEFDEILNNEDDCECSIM